MGNIIEWLDENQWLNIIFLILAGLSIIVSIILYRKSRKRRSPVFDKLSTNVISEKIQRVGQIEVKYQGEKVKDLTVSKIAFWNRGNETINDLDQAPTDKLKVIIDSDFKILESELIFQTSSTNNIRLNARGEAVEVLFDYIDKDEGGIIKLIHTGKNSTNIDLTGTFKGSDPLKRINSKLQFFSVSLVFSLLPFFRKFLKLPWMRSSEFQSLLGWSLVVVGIGFGLAFFLFDESVVDSVFTGFMALTYLALGLLTVFGSNRMPKGFEIFFNDE